MIHKKHLSLAIVLMLVPAQLYTMGSRQKAELTQDIRSLLNTPLADWDQQHIDQIDQKINMLKKGDPTQSRIYAAELDNLKNQMGLQQRHVRAQLQAVQADDKEIDKLKQEIDRLKKEIAQIKKERDEASLQKTRAEEAFFAAKKAYEDRINQIDKDILQKYPNLEPQAAGKVLQISIERANKEADKIHEDYYGTARPQRQ